MGLKYKRIMKDKAKPGRYLTNEAGKEKRSTDQESTVNAVGTTKELPKRVNLGILHWGHSKSCQELPKFGAINS